MDSFQKCMVKSENSTFYDFLDSVTLEELGNLLDEIEEERDDNFSFYWSIESKG